MTRKTRRALFYVALSGSLALLFTGWWLGNKTSLGINGGQLVALGRLFGLLATASVLIEVLLMSRLPFMEQTFDLHENIDLHRLNGYALLLSMCAHIVFITIGYAAPMHTGILSQFWHLNTDYEDVLWATIGTIIFFVVTGLSVHLVRRKLRYEWWYAIHLTVYGAILLTFLHQIKIGGDLVSQRWFLAFWYSMYFLVFGLLGYYRFLRPCINYFRYRFKVEKVALEADGIYSVYITGNNLERFHFEPGQYASWRFLRAGMWFSGHPFSFSNRVGQSSIRFTAKASGDFTQLLSNIPTNTPVLIDGPRGSFTSERAITKDIVLVAGGIGVAPYLALIHELLDHDKQVTLLYAARKPGDIAFRSELAALQGRGLKVQTFMSDDGKFVDKTILEPFTKQATAFYVCGPDIMSKLVTHALRELKVPKERIIAERFAF